MPRKKNKLKKTPKIEPKTKPKRLLVKKEQPLVEETIVARKKLKIPKPLKVFSIIFLLLLILITPPLVAGFWYLSSLSQASGLTQSQIISKIRTGFNIQAKNDQGRTNILILGLDEIAGQKEGSLLTDTIIIASLSPDNQNLTLLSLPRDLWIDVFKTKINALYYYGEISEETNGTDFAKKVIEEITGQTIHYTMVVNLNSLEHIINALDGIDINVPETFTDDKFPRANVDVTTETDPQKLYETITFEKGLQHMDGVNALKYIRSRQSQNLDQGTDIARNSRQQQLISAILAKLKQASTIKNPHLLGNLYKIYIQEIETDLSDEDLIGLVKRGGTTVPQMNTLTLSIQQAQEPGLLYHPPLDKYKQWVYEPLDPSWQDINQFVSQNLP